MMTLRQLRAKPEIIPSTTARYLADLGKAWEKRKLYMRQAPQRLRVIREHTLVEGAIASNRIEGVEIDKARVGTILFGDAMLQDRNEEEVRGCFEALCLIHARAAKLPINLDTVLTLHQLSRGEIRYTGQFKGKGSDIPELHTNNTAQLPFTTETAIDTAVFMKELIELWKQSLEDRRIHPLLALAGFNLDLLCIHPFPEGNGQLSRLLLLLQSCHLGHKIGRYVSVEQIILWNKGRYRKTLEESSIGWHEGNHDPWPYINYVLFILKTAYSEFEARLSATQNPPSVKTELIEAAINARDGKFTVSQLERACPGVNSGLIRQVLCSLQRAGRVKSVSRGPGAAWRKRGNTL